MVGEAVQKLVIKTEVVQNVNRMSERQKKTGRQTERQMEIKLFQAENMILFSGLSCNVTGYTIPILQYSSASKKVLKQN